MRVVAKGMAGESKGTTGVDELSWAEAWGVMKVCV